MNHHRSEEFSFSDQQSSKSDDVKEKMTELFESLNQSIVISSPSDKIVNREVQLSLQNPVKDLLQLPHNSSQDCVFQDSVQEERRQNKHQNNDEKKSWSSRSERNSEKIDEQIADDSAKLNASSSVETASSDIISNLKTSLMKTNDIANENQHAPILDAQASHVDSKLLVEQTNTCTAQTFVKVDIHKNENTRIKLSEWQRDSLKPAETDSKIAAKKRIHAESSDESVLSRKMQKRKESSPETSLNESLNSDNEIHDRKEFSEDKRIHDNNKSEKQIYLDKITEYMTKKKEMYSYQKQKRKRKRQKKIKRLREKFHTLFRDCLHSSKSESDQEREIISKSLRKKKLQFVSNNSKVCDTFNNNTTEEDTESVISNRTESINSSDSTICMENNKLYDFTTDEETNEKTDFNTDKKSTRKCNMLIDTSQEDIQSAIPTKIQRLEQYSVSMEEEDTQKNQENVENINSADEDVKIPRDIRPNLKCSIKFEHKLISNIEEKDSCDVSQNVENVSMNNEDTTKNITTVITDHVSLKSEEDSSNKKDVNEALSSTENVSKRLGANTGNDYPSMDDDNMSDIEVEIKIKPKSKSRISRKYSLKAPLSAVNTCIKNLNTFKNNPDFLGELFQMNFKTSSMKSEENEARNTSEKSLDVNQDETASNTQEVTHNSSHTTKDNTNCSKQQQVQSSQDGTIFDKDKNATQHHQERNDKRLQFAKETTRITSEKSSESAKPTCDESDLEKELPRTPSNDKEKTADEQQKNPHTDITLNENKDATERDQDKRNDHVQPIESAKPARDMPDLEELPKISSELSDAKRTGGVRVRTSVELGSSWNFVPLNLSTKHSDSSVTSNNACSASASSAREPCSLATKPPFHSSTNLSGAPTENIPPNFNDDVMICNMVLKLVSNFALCRKILLEQIFTEEKICNLHSSIAQIYYDMKHLKTLFRTTSDDYIINYINRQKYLSLPISIVELKQYKNLFQNSAPIITGIAPFYDTRYSNVPQSSNINNSSMPSASVHDHIRSPFMGNIPAGPLPRMQNIRAEYQSSTMPCPRPNVNRAKSTRSKGNPPRSRQPVSNIRPRMVPTINIQMPNPTPNPTGNLQQPIGVMYSQTYGVQGPRMPTMLNVNNQQFLVNPNNNPHVPPSSVASTTNINHCVYLPAKEKANVSSTTANIRSHIETRTTIPSNVATTNVQQPNQAPIYSQMLYHPPFTTSQNINEACPMMYNVIHPKVCTSVNAPRNDANITRNVGPGNSFANPPTPLVPTNEKNVPEYNKNLPNSFATQFARVHVQNISSNVNQELLQNLQQLPKETYVHLVNSLSNGVSQNVPNKRTEIIPETQIGGRVLNKTSFAKPQQDSHQGTPCVHNESSRKPSDVPPRVPVSREPNVSQNATSRQSKTIFILPKPAPVLPNEIFNYHFDLGNLTEIQKVILKDQLQFCLKQCSFYKTPEQNCKILCLERKMLIFFYESLHNYINKMMKENDTNKNHVGKKLRNDTSQKASTCDKMPRKQSPEQNTDPNIPISSKSTTVNKDLSMEAQNMGPRLESTPKSALIEASPSETVDLQEQNMDTLKKRFKRHLFVATENIKTSLTGHSVSSNIPKENPIAETLHGISETRAQDDAEINKTAKSLAENTCNKRLSESCSPLAQNTSDLLPIVLSNETGYCSKIAKDDAKGIDNVEAENISEISNVATLSDIEGNQATSKSSFNLEMQDNIKDKKTVKSLAKDERHDERLLKSNSSPVQNALSLSQNKIKDDDINVEGSDNAEMDLMNVCKISNIAVLNSSRGNEKAASQVPCNEARNEEPHHNEACNLSNKISGKNSQDGTHDNVEENVKKSRSNFAEAQSDMSFIPRTSTPLVSDDTSELFSTKEIRNESVKTTQTREKCTSETSLGFFLSTKQDPANEQIHDSGKMYENESFESSGNLQIDENAEKSNSNSQEEQGDKDTLDTSQNLCFDETRCEFNLEMTSADHELKLLTMEERNVQKRSEKLLLNQKGMRAEEISPSVVLKDTSNAKELENENQIQMDTHSSIKAINELLRHVSEHKSHGKPRTSSCNPIMKNNATNVNVSKGIVDKNDISHVNVASPTKNKDDFENSDIILNILNVTSISSSLFEKIDHSEALSQDEFALLNEMKEKRSSYMNDNPEIVNSVSSNEMKMQEESSDVNDNPKVSNSASFNEIKMEEPLDVIDNPDVSDSTSLNKMEEKSSVVEDDLKVQNSVSLNEMKREEPLDIEDNPNVSDSTLLNEMKKEKSSIVEVDLEIQNSASSTEIKMEESLEKKDNPDVSDSTLLNEIKMEEPLDIEDNPNVSDSTSLNEMKEENSSVVEDDLEVQNSVSLNEIKMEEPLDIEDNPNVSDSTSLNEMKEEKSSIVEVDLEIQNSASSTEIKMEEPLDIEDNPNVSDSTLLNEMKKEKSSVVEIDLEIQNSASSTEIKMEEPLKIEDNPDVSDSTLLNEIKMEEPLDIEDNPNVSDSTSLNEMKEENSSVVKDDLKVQNSASLNEIKMEEPLDLYDDPEVQSSTSSNKMKEEKLLNMNSNRDIYNSVWLNEIKEEKLSNVNDNPEVLNSTSSNELKKGNSSGANDNLQQALDEYKPCLRCKRKSTVYCKACLEAPYCSKRCSDLHWKASHYKQCKNHYKPVICIDLLNY